MSDDMIKQIADSANFIVSGYAFTERKDGFVSILNLNHPDCAMVVNRNSEIIETNMDPIEQKIVVDLSRRNLQFLDI
ncbi:MAG: hypothetical protein IJT56_02110 [Clostridia bacterium]|nr:hypothetical protein [Clostridia bacterium]